MSITVVCGKTCKSRYVPSKKYTLIGTGCNDCGWFFDFVEFGKNQTKQTKIKKKLKCFVSQPQGM